jgi:hypothetical protein
MKRKTVFGFSILLAVLVLPQLAVGQQAREFRKTVAFEPGAELTFGTDKGSVKLTAWDRREVEVYARIEPPVNESADYGRRAVEAAQIEITGTASALTIRSNFDAVPSKDSRWGDNRTLPDIHYEIKAPRELKLRLTADRSRVSVHGFAGRLQLQTDRTPVEAGELSGEILLKVDRGEVRLNALRGSLNLSTDRTDSHILGLAIEKDSQLNISRGEAELRVPETQRLSVSARTGRRETFQSDFEIATRSLNTDLIEGTINGGGPRLSVSGDRSQVHLRRQ